MATHQPRATLVVALSVVVGVAVIGLAAGLRSEAPAGAPPTPAPEAAASAPPARGYAELRRAPPAAVTPWAGTTREGPPAPDGTPIAAALDARAGQRAYDGAPPTIPHPVRQSSAAECLACHRDGVAIRGRVARPVSHPEYASCTQCHVVEDRPMPGGDWLAEGPPADANVFAGLAAPAAGPRAWDIAPPQIPHRTHMREQCLSCHGPYGRSPMRSSHPERQNCQQCHAPAAALDQRAEVLR
jgi:cytochrome c-type protein NapB